jgi:hypothetical protein
LPARIEIGSRALGEKGGDYLDARMMVIMNRRLIIHYGFYNRAAEDTSSESGVAVANRSVERDTRLICRGCKWIGEAFMWEPEDAPGWPSARIDLASATCVPCQRIGGVRVLRDTGGRGGRVA